MLLLSYVNMVCFHKSCVKHEKLSHKCATHDSVIIMTGCPINKCANYCSCRVIVTVYKLYTPILAYFLANILDH